MKKVNYRLPDTGKTVAASILCDNGDATLLFVPSNVEDRSPAIVIAHDDDLDGIFEDMEANWFNVEVESALQIARNLVKLAKGN